MHRSVARTMIAEGRIAEADASLGKAAELYRQLQIRTELANCHWMRGYMHAQNGDMERAESELREAQAMHSAQRATLYTSQVAVELADVLHRRGKSDEAAALLHDVLGDLNSERGAVHSAAAHRLLGIIAEDARDTETAEEHYVRALSLLERAGAAGDLADLCRLLGDLLRRTGRIEAALDAYRTGLGHRTAPGTTTLGPARRTRRSDEHLIRSAGGGRHGSAGSLWLVAQSPRPYGREAPRRGLGPGSPPSGLRPGHPPGPGRCRRRSCPRLGIGAGGWPPPGSGCPPPPPP